MANQITVFLDPTKMPNQSQAQATFDSNLAAIFATFPTFGAQVNSIAANLNSIAAGGAYAIPYVYSASSAPITTNSVTTNQCAVDSVTTPVHLYLNRTIASGSVDPILQTLGLSTSTVKGYIRLVSQSDITKWVIFSVAGVANGGSNFIDCTVGMVQSSSGTSVPFVNGDTVMLSFQRTGDMGATGPAGGGSMTLLASTNITGSPTSVDYLTLFGASYDKYVIDIEGLMNSNTVPLIVYLANSGVVDSAAHYYNPAAHGSSLSSATTVFSCGTVSSSAITAATMCLEIRNANDALKPKGFGVYGVANMISQAMEGAYTGSVVSGFRISANTGVFTGGIVRVYGVKNS